MTTIRSKVTVVCDGERLVRDEAGERAELCGATCEVTLTIRELALPRPGPGGQVAIQPFEGKQLELPEGWVQGTVAPKGSPIVLAGGMVQIDTIKDALAAIATKVQHPQPGMLCPSCVTAAKVAAPDRTPTIDPRRIVSGGAG